MSNLVGLALAVAILALAAAVALPTIEAVSAPVGAYQLVAVGVDHVYRIDTTTGDAWISVDGGDWEAIDEASEPAPSKNATAPARAAVVQHARLRTSETSATSRSN